MERNRVRERVLKGERDIFKEIEREFKRERERFLRSRERVLKEEGDIF